MSSGPHPVAGSHKIQSPHVLIVEDERDMVESLTSILEMHGITAEGFGSLAAALRALKPGGSCCVERVDCLLVDLGLPDAQGTEAIVALRTACPHIPIVVSTGNYDLGEAAILAGAQSATLKPARPEELVWSIRYAVARHKVRGDYRESETAMARAQQKVDFLGKATGSGEV